MCLLCLVLVQLTGNVTGINSNITNWLCGGFALFALLTVVAAVCLKPGSGGISFGSRRQQNNMLIPPQQDTALLISEINRQHDTDLALIEALHQQDMALVQNAMVALAEVNARQADSLNKALDIFDRISKRDKELILQIYDMGIRISQSGPPVLSLPPTVDAVSVKEIELTDDQIAGMRYMQEIQHEHKLKHFL